MYLHRWARTSALFLFTIRVTIFQLSGVFAGISPEDADFIRGLEFVELLHLASMFQIVAPPTAKDGPEYAEHFIKSVKGMQNAQRSLLKDAITELRWGVSPQAKDLRAQHIQDLGTQQTQDSGTQHIQASAPVSQERPDSARTLQNTSLMQKQSSRLLAVNFIDQTKMYLHHAVFDKMPARPRQVNSVLYVTEFSGLLVPRDFDCNNFDPGGGSLCGHDYSASTPSRWFLCAELVMRAFAGLKHFVPSLPVIDDEYFEAVTIYDKVLSARTYFAVAEFGARWGTWGLRALAALREYNQEWPMPYSLFFAEPCLQGCNAIKQTAALNSIDNYTLWCEYADASSFEDWARGQPWIDVVDLDIQGAEYHLIPQIMHILNSKVKRVIVGLHATSNDALRRLFHNWTFHVDVPPNIVNEQAGPCYEDVFIRGLHWHDQSVLQDVPVCRNAAFNTLFGPIMHFDGEWIMDNRAFDAQHR
jgi:hypothetical protein